MTDTERTPPAHALAGGFHWRDLRWIAAVAVVASSAAGCAYNWTSDLPGTFPGISPHRDSAVVTVFRSRTRLVMHHEPSSFWCSGGEQIVRQETEVESCQDLDVRTCKTTWRWSCGRSAESDVSVAERAVIGSVRFVADERRTSDLMAVNTLTGQRWTAAVGFGQIASVIAVPAARRVVVMNQAGSIFAYDLDANRTVVCK